MFCGVGGFRLGLERAGEEFRCIWANDNDRDACDVYRKNFGDGELVERDIHEIHPDDIPDHDLLTAGFPCPDFSRQGTGKGYKGKEGRLLLELFRIAEAKQPKYMLLENVEGFLRFKAFALIEIEKLGYEWEYAVLNTLAFGLPQNRKRVFIFCVRRDCRFNPQQVQRIQRKTASYFHSLFTDVEDTKRGWARPRHSKQGWHIKKDATRVGRTTSRFSDRLDSVRMRLMGNAVSIPVITAIGMRLLEVIEAGHG